MNRVLLFFFYFFSFCLSAQSRREEKLRIDAEYRGKIAQQKSFHQNEHAQSVTYFVDTIQYQPYPFTGSSLLNGQDDHWTDSMAIGFTFNYFGHPYTQLCVGSNGQVSFALSWIYSSLGAPAGNAYSQFNGWSITTAMPNAFDMPPSTICAPFRDIDAGQGGGLFYQVIGNAPNHVAVASWSNVPLFDQTLDCPAASASTFQVAMYEGTDVIEIYVQNSTACHGWNNGYGIVGIQDSSATVAYVPAGYNYPNAWTATNKAWRFCPSSSLACQTTGMGKPRDAMFTMSPNPSSGSVTINGMPEGAQFFVTDVLGKVVKSGQAGATELRLELAEAGLYFIHVLSEGQGYTSKLVVTR